MYALTLPQRLKIIFFIGRLVPLDQDFLPISVTIVHTTKNIWHELIVIAFEGTLPNLESSDKEKRCYLYCMKNKQFVFCLRKSKSKEQKALN